MKVDGLDIDVGVEGVLVEENCTTCVMGHVEAIRKKIVVNAVRRLLQGKDTPPSCNLFLKGIFFSTSGSSVPVVDAESPLHNRTSSKVLIGTVFVRRCSTFPLRRLAKFCCSLLNINHMQDQDLCSLIFARVVNRSVPGVKFFVTAQDFIENGSSRRPGKGPS